MIVWFDHLDPAVPKASICIGFSVLGANKLPFMLNLVGVGFGSLAAPRA